MLRFADFYADRQLLYPLHAAHARTRGTVIQYAHAQKCASFTHNGRRPHQKTAIVYNAPLGVSNNLQFSISPSNAFEIVLRTLILKDSQVS